MCIAQSPDAFLSFENLRLSRVSTGWMAQFCFEGEELSIRASERAELEQRLMAMQLALYTVPADQWMEIKTRGKQRYELPRADGSGFVVSHDGEGLPYCTPANDAPDSVPMSARELSARGVMAPMLGL